MKIALIRHGMTEGNKKKRYIGSTDEPLSDTRCLMHAYPLSERIFSSPLVRCVQTAEFIYPEQRIEIIDDLRECDFGDFENKSYEDLKDHPAYVRFLESGGTLPFPNGEEHDAFKARCVRAFMTSLPKDGEIVSYIIHGGTIMAIMQHIFGGDFYEYQIKNGEYILLDYDGETFAKGVLND